MNPKFLLFLCFSCAVLCWGIWIACYGEEVAPIEGPDPAELTISPPPDGMVLIPAGEFEMGSNDAEAYSSEQPVRTVYVDAFYMDKSEVTNADYAVFLNAKGKHSEAGHTWLDIGSRHAQIEFVAGEYRVKAGYENHPVVGVSWYGAMAYAEWAGKRLPTKAEWEKAARGRLVGLKYPWGNTIDSSKANYDCHNSGTTAVGKYAANGYGLYDMSGNVWEWCLDEFYFFPREWWLGAFYFFPREGVARNPLSGINNVAWLLDNYTKIKYNPVLRGGSWYDTARNVRVAAYCGAPPTYAIHNVGFRCVRAVTP